MNNHNTSSTGVAPATQTQVPTSLKPLLKVALDVHLALYVAAVQEDGSHPKPPQRFKPADFLHWIDKQRARGFRIVTCYEAGPLGFVLHRQLTARGVTNYVVRPRVWDEQRGRVKTDGRDALWMLNALDRFCAGNKKALGLVRVPTEEEERKRSHSRLRQALARDRQMTAQRGPRHRAPVRFSVEGRLVRPQKLAALAGDLAALAHRLARTFARHVRVPARPDPRAGRGD
jgi:transposase